MMEHSYSPNTWEMGQEAHEFEFGLRLYSKIMQNKFGVKALEIRSSSDVLLSVTNKKTHVCVVFKTPL